MSVPIPRPNRQAWSVLVPAVLALLLVTPGARAQFWFDQTANPVVVRVGDGSTTLSASAAPVALQQYLAGQANQTQPASSVGFAASGANRLVLAGNAVSEGNLTNSVDRAFLTLGGFDADSGTASIAASP